MNRQKKTMMIILSSITMAVLLGLGVYFGMKPQSCQSQEKAESRVMTDRNGHVLDQTEAGRYYDMMSGGGDEVSGKDLMLTIDHELQQFGEALMEGKRGSIVAIEPSTGEVLCMASDVSEPMAVPSIAGSYPPGGVFKTVQALVLLSEGIITPQTRYSCEGGFEREGVRIVCRHHKPLLSLADALSRACNGYFCQAYLDMMENGKYGSVQDAMERWHDYVVSFGFGYQLGIDLPHEKRGAIPTADFYDKAYKGQWNGETVLGNAVGQGEILATPLQIANLSAIIANRGYYHIPHVVKGVQGQETDGKYSSAYFTKASREAFDAVIMGMGLSVLNGTCRSLSTLPIRLCGVSGTALSKENRHSVFIGFAPIENPRIAVAVYVENGGWGAKYAAPIGGLVMEKYLRRELTADSKDKAEQIRTQHLL